MFLRKIRTPATSPPSVDVLSHYIKTAPSAQNAIDIFQGNWSSQFPKSVGVTSGFASLFEDVRIQWFAKTIGGIQERRVIELGPLEGAHSYMLEELGASQIIAVESNSRAYLKCLITKEVMRMQKTRFLLGDFVEYLRSAPDFDVCLASGVLYHVSNPAELISLIADHCREYLLLWTHYYDREIIQANPGIAGRFTNEIPGEHRGFRYQLYRQEYQDTLGWAGYCGGTAEYSHWITKSDLFRCLEFFGFEVIDTNFENTTDGSGPAFALVAKRKK